MKKRNLLALASILMVGGLVACGGDTSSATSAESQASSEATTSQVATSEAASSEAESSVVASSEAESSVASSEAAPSVGVSSEEASSEVVSVESSAVTPTGETIEFVASSLNYAADVTNGIATSGTKEDDGSTTYSYAGADAEVQIGEIVPQFSFYIKSGKKIDVENHSKNGYTMRIKLSSGDNKLVFKPTAAAVVTVYAISSNGSTPRAIKLENQADNTVVTGSAESLGGANVETITYNVSAGGTYYWGAYGNPSIVGTANGGINVYAASIQYLA